MVRRWFAKPLYVGSTPTGASNRHPSARPEFMPITRITTVPNEAAGYGGALLRDFISGHAPAREFYPENNLQSVLDGINSHTYPRAEVSASLTQTQRDLNAPAQAIANAQALKEQHVYAIITGQQAGFLGGPLYTLYKAIATIKLAEELNAKSANGARFVPVFWVAGDDHDLDEIGFAEFLSPDGTTARIDFPYSPESAGRPAYRAHMNPAQADDLQSKLAALISPQAAAEWIDLYRAHDCATTFAIMLSRWLGGLGLVVAPSQSMRPFAAPVLLRELEDYAHTTRIVHETGVRIKESGYTPGFPDKLRDAPHFFIETKDGIRASLTPVPTQPGDEPAFLEKSAAFDALGIVPQTHTVSELRNQLHAAPERFSAAAALRPIVQQSVFPVAAVVLGPGEMAYWAHLEPLHRHFGAIWPLISPRPSLTLLDAAAEKSLRKLNLTESDPALFDPAQLREKTLRSAPLSAELSRLESNIQSEFKALETLVTGADPSLQSMTVKTRERIEHELARIREKTLASLESRDSAAAARVARLTGLIRPHNNSQERIFCCAQWIALAPDLPTTLAGLESFPYDRHTIVMLGS